MPDPMLSLDGAVRRSSDYSAALLSFCTNAPQFSCNP
jgi:hypothetical protein